MNGRAFIDTNVLVYLFDTDARAKQLCARNVLDTHRATASIVISTQVLQEFYVAVTRKLARPLAESDARAVVADLALLPVAQVDAGMILAAIDLGCAEQLSFWDALIVESALEADCRVLLSEDLQDGRRYGRLIVENPFRDLVGG
jgi:predicted nucleic acid-binding protein